MLTGELTDAGRFEQDDIHLASQRFRFERKAGFGAEAERGIIKLGEKGFKGFFPVGGQAVNPMAIIMHEFAHTRFGDKIKGEIDIYAEKRAVLNWEVPVRFLLGVEPRASYYSEKFNETISILTNEPPRKGKWSIDYPSGVWTPVR